METLSVEERKAVRNYGKEYKKFLEQSVCASWTAKTIIEKAEKAGFKPFPKELTRIRAGQKYYFNNDYESVALAVVGQEHPLKTGFNIVGAHMDSPQLELKPSTVKETDGIVQLKTKFRGGGTWITWFNRPLGIAGRVYEPVLGEDGKPQLDPDTHLPMQKERFVRIDSPGLVIPIEAIHVNRKLNEGKEIDKETDLNPVAAISRLNEDELFNTVSENVIETLKKKHIDLSKANRAELFLFPTSPPSDIGVDNSMILAQGHDDRAMCYAALQGIIEAGQGVPPLKTSIAYFFDNEETGSQDRGGATSRWAENIAGELVRGQALNQQNDMVQAREKALSKSFIFSADVAHGAIPPHAKYYDPLNAVYLGKGPVVKSDSSGHYATTPKGMAIVEDLCTRANIPFQTMSTHQNVPCGTTIGPMISASTNALTVDIGAPIVSMHSAQELGATVDFYLTKELFRHFFRND